MSDTYTVRQAQAQLPRLLRSKKTVTICRRDEPIFYLVPKPRWEAIAETLELLSNPKAMRTLRAAKAGKLKYKPLDLNDEDLMSDSSSSSRSEERPIAACCPTAD
jgi:PHD/YefM family antitoxin component YafN of YafNO toxin-antitoxin module